jgi:hypothetical protein
MKTSLSRQTLDSVFSALRSANGLFLKTYPGETDARQPVHTVYGGAHIFKADSAGKLGASALQTLREYAPNFVELARALELPGHDKLPTSPKQVRLFEQRLKKDPEAVRRRNEGASLANAVYLRVVEKLKREPIEDFRIDFEDGYGYRSDGEEDGHAASAAGEVARGFNNGTLPPFIGIRLKPFSEELKQRAVRTLDIFLTTLLEKTGGRLPENFVVTLPKVVFPGQIAALVELFSNFESKTALHAGALKLEIMVETSQSIFNSQGEVTLPSFVAAADGRCIAAHFGVYDYTASINIIAEFQSMTHPACDFARTAMKVSLAGTGVWLSDGATNVMPVGPHRQEKGRPLTARQRKENRDVVHRAWKLGFDQINHSLYNGFYQGWDLHPAQIPVRYAAVYAFFLRGLEAASIRLKTFIDKAARATLIGDVFDDAATGQGLLNFFLRGISCGAITEREAQASGLTLEEIRTRSFMKILNGRKETHK